MTQRLTALAVTTLAAALAGLATSHDAYAACGGTGSCSNPSGPALDWMNSGATSYGLEGDQAGGGIGVLGTDQAFYPNPPGFGVAGETFDGVGVVGVVQNTVGIPSPPHSNIGVWGVTLPSSTGYGVYGTAPYGYGMYGTSTNGVGLYGTGATGVYGTSSSGNGGYFTTSASAADGVYSVISSGWSAVAGQNNSNGPGVWGYSSTGDGLYGTGATGVYGTGTGQGVYGTGPFGVEGSGSGTSSVGVVGNCSGSGCLAAYFNGNGEYTGSWTKSSDGRLKKNVETLNDSLDTLLRLRGVSYEWKEPSKHGDLTGKQYGFIAQEYEKVFPGAVRTDADGFKSIDTTGLDSLQVEAFREQQAEINDLRARLKAVEEGRRPMISWNPSWGIFAAGLVIGGVMLVNNRRRRDEEKRT